MKGKRGNTMLFPWEAERLINLIRDENKGSHLEGQHFSFDTNSYSIISGSKTLSHNLGKLVSLEWNNVRNSETHFQAFILQNLQVENNNFYPEIFGRNIVWIGNEVFAGSGMQKIDLMTIERINETRLLFRIIELKHPKSRMGINFAASQLEYYINWAREDIGGHILGAYQFNIKPVLLILTSELYDIPENVVDGISKLSSISFEPEIWQIDFQGTCRKI